MRIHRIQTQGTGPLPAVDWQPGDCEVVYDDNQTGKTTLIDLLIETVFSEGRKTIFEDQDRYDGFPDTTVELSEDEDRYAFTDDGTDVALSDLLGWKLPELNRLLCVRASQVEMGGPQEDADIWKALASVIEGLEDDYVEKLKDTICDLTNITSRRFAWSSTKGNDHFKETILNDVVPKLDRAEEAEERLAELLHRREERRELQETVDALREERIPGLRTAIQERENQLALLDLGRSERELEEALTLRNRLQQDFGRIDPAFEDPWEEAHDALETLRRDRKQKQERNRTRGRKEDELEERRETVRAELSELDEAIAADESTLEEREATLRERREETAERQRRAGELSRRLEELPNVPPGSGGAGILLGLVVLLGGVLTPYTVLSPILDAAAGGLLALGGLIMAGLRYRWQRRRDRLVETGRKLLAETTGERRDSEEPTVGALKAFHEAPPEEFLGDIQNELDGLRERLQAKRERRSSLKTELENLEERLEELREEPPDTEDLEAKIQDHEATCESYRQKTGLPDFETYRERLEDRREIEGELQSLISRLQGRLDLDGEDPDLADIQTVLDRRREALEDVTPPEDDRGALEDELETRRAKLEDLQARLRDREETLAELERTLREQDRLLHELEVDPDEPEALFEVKRNSRRRLEEAVRDRMAGALILRVLDSLEEGYLDRVRELLEGPKEDDGWSLSHAYGAVMGEEHRVDFDPETLRLTIHADGLQLPESALSSGARTHLYLSCRLVALRRLFRERPGFVLLDDPFLTYFPSRKQRAIELLEPLLDDGWQILCFTVDPDTRDHLTERLDAVQRSIDDLAVRTA